MTIALTSNDLIVVHHNQPLTTSVKVAEVFGRRHAYVLEKIQGLDCSENFSSANFSVHDQEIAIGKGAKRKSKVYEMTKDGFMFLVMGFTGKKAAQIKEAYINAFNEMAEKIYGTPTARLTPPQQRHVQKRVSELAHVPGNSYRTVYGSIKDQFQVGTYKDVPADRYQELCEFLHCEPIEGELIQAETSSQGVELDSSAGTRLYVLMIHYERACQELQSLYAAARALDSKPLLRVWDHLNEARPAHKDLRRTIGSRLESNYLQRVGAR
ncbi:Rha family transcriptional regulator [Marinobacter sp. JSM 1782161]|uniref:Rha family transcriptional regulator n=1 Tax=Marinobacter sp. JSM 1782161 TaxID=2685906 RepID=UPI001402C5EC|nr:Rha family transcriptional regulator [Marinobacter sp. JSM 1782161]